MFVKFIHLSAILVFMSNINNSFTIKINKSRTHSQAQPHQNDTRPARHPSRKTANNQTFQNKGKWHISLIKDSVLQKYISAEFNKKLEVIKSDEYQNLLKMIGQLREEKEHIILGLKEAKYEKELELKGMVKCKNRAKMEIWDCMGKISKVKDEIQQEQIKNKILHDYIENEDSSLHLSTVSQSNLDNERAS